MVLLGCRLMRLHGGSGRGGRGSAGHIGWLDTERRKSESGAAGNDKQQVLRTDYVAGKCGRHCRLEGELRHRSITVTMGRVTKGDDA